VNGKAMATASPALLFASLGAAVWLVQSRRRAFGAVLVAVIGGGVLWSNVLAYRGAWLAPQPQLAELEHIGNRFAGEGPTLYTEVQPFGTHFLRRMEAEGTVGSAGRRLPLENGDAPEGYVDLDNLRLDGVLIHKTLVLRRSPSESRPPVPYKLVSRGAYYEVWQRSSKFAPVLDQLSLGNVVAPGAIPRCADVLRLARRLPPGGRLAAVRRDTLTGASFSAAGPLEPLYLGEAKTIDSYIGVSRDARYTFWLGGSFRSRLRLSVDDHQIADQRFRSNSAGMWTLLATVPLEAGNHHIVVRYSGPDLHPGSGGTPFGFGPLVLTRDTDDAPVIFVPPARARSLCGKNLDWVEALGS